MQAALPGLDDIWGCVGREAVLTITWDKSKRGVKIFRAAFCNCVSTISGCNLWQERNKLRAPQAYELMYIARMWEKHMHITYTSEIHMRVTRSRVPHTRTRKYIHTGGCTNKQYAPESQARKHACTGRFALA